MYLGEIDSFTESHRMSQSSEAKKDLTLQKRRSNKILQFMNQEQILRNKFLTCENNTIPMFLSSKGSSTKLRHVILDIFKKPSPPSSRIVLPSQNH